MLSDGSARHPVAFDAIAFLMALGLGPELSSAAPPHAHRAGGLRTTRLQGVAARLSTEAPGTSATSVPPLNGCHKHPMANEWLHK